MCGNEKFPSNYVRSYRFGLPPLGKKELDTLLRRGQAIDKYGKYNNILAKILIRESYEVEYDLYNHNDPTLSHPFQSHLMTDKKSHHKDGPVRRLMERYHEFNIQKYFGISLIEFMNLPCTVYHDVLDIAYKIIREESKAITDMEREQAKLMGDNLVQDEIDYTRQMM